MLGKGDGGRAVDGRGRENRKEGKEERKQNERTEQKGEEREEGGERQRKESRNSHSLPKKSLTFLLFAGPVQC